VTDKSWTSQSEVLHHREVPDEHRHGNYPPNPKGHFYAGYVSERRQVLIPYNNATNCSTHVNAASDINERYEQNRASDREQRADD
jgi:hypothetical protein